MPKTLPHLKVDPVKKMDATSIMAYNMYLKKKYLEGKKQKLQKNKKVWSAKKDKSAMKKKTMRKKIYLQKMEKKNL